MSLQISIRDEKPAEPQPVMKLWLEQGEDRVILRATDGAGKDWGVAVINADGIRIVGFISPDTGWPLDSEGHLKLITK